MPVNAIAVIVSPEQIVCDDGVATVLGTGFTSVVAVTAVPIQLLAVGVMVNVAVTGNTVVLIKAPLMSPDPIAAIPVIVSILFLVQL